MTSESITKISGLYDNTSGMDDEEVKKAISRAIKPDKNISSLPPLKTTPKRVLLVIPPGTPEESFGRLSGATGELPMLGLAYISAALRDQGNIVKIVDYEVNRWSFEKVREDIEAFAPDLVGMTAYITNMRRCSAVAEIVKQVNPKIKVVLGGPQVSIFPEEGLASPHVDLIVLSEGEIIIRNVINALDDEEELKKVPGIWFKLHSGEIVRNEKQGLVDNLDIFPPPALDLFEMEKYFPSVMIRGKKIAHLLTTRGCPFECSFCETKLTFGRSFRYHSRDRVIAELDALIKAGFASFQFYDDIFTANRKIVVELCERIIEKKWAIQWMCYTRSDCIDRELLRLMKKAGCYLISFGTESGDDSLLQGISKGLTVQENLDGIRMAREEGLQIFITNMLGLPRESYEQSQKTIQFAIESGAEYATFGITEPYPGTELWVDAKKYGYFDASGKYQNSLLSGNSAVWIPHGRTRKELEQTSFKAFCRFYFRPMIFLNVIKNFYFMPFGRALRFFIASIKFLCSSFKSVKSGTRC